MKSMKTKKNLKVLPTFSSEEQERNFWERQDSTDYLD